MIFSTCLHQNLNCYYIIVNAQLVLVMAFSTNNIIVVDGSIKKKSF